MDDKGVAGKSHSYHRWILWLTLPIIFNSLLLFGGGWEIFLLGPVIFIALIFCIIYMSKKIKESGAGPLSTFFAFFILLSCSLLLRLTTPIVTDGDLGYAVYAFSEIILIEYPNIPQYYGLIISILFLATIAYIAMSFLVFQKVINKEPNKKLLNPNFLIIMFLIITLIAFVPIVSALEKFFSPEHETSIYNHYISIYQYKMDDIADYTYQAYYLTHGSYEGICDDSSLREMINNKNAICRGGSNNEFVYYFKINKKDLFVCVDSYKIDIVKEEPKGLYCDAESEEKMITVVKIEGQPLDSSYKHLGSGTGIDCGILGYKDYNERSIGIGGITCFNEAIKNCTPAAVSGVANNFTITYRINGMESGNCILTTEFFRREVYPTENTSETASFKCVIDPSTGWRNYSSNSCEELF